MKEFEKILFALQPKFGSEGDSPEMFFFDWFIYTNPEAKEQLNNKQKLLLFQMFIAHMSMELVLGNTGMRENFQAAKPKHKITKKQSEAIWKGMSRLYVDIMERYFDETQLMIEKPKNLNLYENN